MTREIKFKGKRLDNGEWIYGDLSHSGGETLIFPSEAMDSYDRYLVDPASIGQYTGLEDKNGKEIYEGDIIAFEQEKNFKTEHILPMQVEWSDYGNGMVGWSQFSPIDMFAVIGNIHDNLELLNAE